VFKLKEIDERCRLFRSGQHVLDLGAAPGSWSLYASERVGKHGVVLAIDLYAIDQVFTENVVVVQGDALAPDQPEMSANAPYDVVLSDMAPRTSGTKSRDQALSFELCMGALGIAGHLGKPGSHFVAKIFMSNDFAEAKRAVTQAYQSCRVIKPEGTRSNSSEVFLVGTGRRSPSS
jgi:23S rRNA (uridine2552-2'-O)-methyltransferase